MIHLCVLISLILIEKLSANIKFGFILNDENNIFIEKFVAFGVMPEDTTEDEQFHVVEEMNRLHRYQRKLKETNNNLNFVSNAASFDQSSSFSSSSSSSFSIENNNLFFNVNLFDQIQLPNGNYQVALKGELSTFLAVFRLTVINSAKNYPESIWGRVKFYSDPISIVSELPNDGDNLRISLFKAALFNFEIRPNEDLKELEHPRSFSKTSDYSIDDLIELFEILEFEEDDTRYTILEFHPSTGSLENPLLSDNQNKKINLIKSKRFINDRNCCAIS